MEAVAKPSSLPGTVASARSPRGCVQPPASSPLASQRVCLGACPVEGLALPHSLQFHVPFSSAFLRSEFSLTTCHTLMVNLKTSAGFSTRIKQPTHRPRVAAPAPSHPLPRAYPRCGVHAAAGRALAIGAHRPSLATSPRPECGPQRCGTWENLCLGRRAHGSGPPEQISRARSSAALGEGKPVLSTSFL